MIIRPRRSVLYMPGSNARAMEKARSLPADSLILDLEDAVAPDAKDSARKLVVEQVRRGGFGSRELIVRVNPPGSRWGEDDLAAIAGLPIDGVLVPKVESAGNVRSALAALDRAGGRPELPVWAMVETPRSILSVDEISGAHPRLSCIVMGTSDLTKEMRARHTRDRIALVAPLGMALLGARAHGLDIIDGVHLDLEDDEGFWAACRQARDMGFDGKSLIHPKQIDPANEVFTPTPDEVSRAREILDAWRQAEREGRGVVVVRGQLIENLHVEEANRTLKLFSAIRGMEGR